MSHKKGQGESAFDWRSKVPAHQRQAWRDGKGDDNDEAMEEEDCELSLFVEPIEWMKGQVEMVEGKVRYSICDEASFPSSSSSSSRFPDASLGFTIFGETLLK